MTGAAGGVGHQRDLDVVVADQLAHRRAARDHRAAAQAVVAVPALVDARIVGRMGHVDDDGHVRLEHRRR